MRFQLIPLPIFLAAAVVAQPLDSRLLSLIPGDAWFAAGVDVERYRDSALTSLPPFALDAHPFGLSESAARQLRQIIVVQGQGDDRGPTVTILRGAMAGATSVAVESSLTPEEALLVLDTETAVFGDSAGVNQAMNRWSRPATQNAELAAKLTRMSESFDNWFLAVLPIENAAGPTISTAPLKYRSDFLHLVGEVRAGIRLGGIDQIQVEVDMNTAEDAAGLVAVGRWLPGLLQMRAGEWEGALADLAENVLVWQTGATASLSFTLDESKVKEFVQLRPELQRWRRPMIIE